MIKTAVHRSRKNKIAQTQLFDMTQALKIRAVDKWFNPSIFGRCELHRAMYGIFDDVKEIIHNRAILANLAI